MLTQGSVRDIRVALVRLKHAGHMRYLLGGKPFPSLPKGGYDADSLRRSMSGTRNWKRTVPYEEQHCLGQRLVKNTSRRLTDSR